MFAWPLSAGTLYKVGVQIMGRNAAVGMHLPYDRVTLRGHRPVANHLIRVVDVVGGPADTQIDHLIGSGRCDGQSQRRHPTLPPRPRLCESNTGVPPIAIDVVCDETADARSPTRAGD